jgi:2-hydroxy-3-keto-5-methylthiopentenyl-1-phosphate phosphatase
MTRSTDSDHIASRDAYQAILVSDFDGTMTRHDFYRLAISQLIPPDCPNHWLDYRSGRMTHFEALQAYFSSIKAGEREVLAVVDQMELDPRLAESIGKLRAHRWHVVVTSAGCDWYIRHLLARAKVDIEVYANPGVYVGGKGLQMSLPTDEWFFSPTVGVDKAGVVDHWLSQGYRVAFAGDGFPDADAAKRVDASMRFAKGDLADQLQREKVPFQKFDVWSDIACQLLCESI